MESAARRHETASMKNGDNGSLGSHGASPPNAGNRKKCDPLFFAPLSADDEFDIYDIELQVESGGKAEITVRPRHGGKTRPIYKAEKTLKVHLLSKKKNLNIIVSRNDAWDSANAEILQGVKGFKYIPIWEGWDLHSRALSVTATKSMVLAGTSRGGAFTLSQSCGSYDPVKLPQARDCLSHHFFPMHMSNFETATHSTSRGERSLTRLRGTLSNVGIAPEVLDKPYAGGGYFVFDCHSQGRKELLSTLYCTGYDRRHRVRNGDIAVAEVRLPVLPTLSEEDGPKRDLPAWARFLKERHAVLYISKRGGEAVFHGSHVGMSVPNAAEGNRYSLTHGQGQEIVISAVCMMLLSVDNDRGDKKIDWMMNRAHLERRVSVFSSGQNVNDIEDGASITDNSSVGELSPGNLMGFSDHWSQRSYTPSVRGESVLIPPADSPISETTADGPFTPVDERGHYPPVPDHDHPNPQMRTLYPPNPDGSPRTDHSDYEQSHYSAMGERKERYSDVPEIQNVVPHQLAKFFPQPPLFPHPSNAHKSQLPYINTGPGELSRESMQVPRMQGMQVPGQIIVQRPPSPQQSMASHSSYSPVTPQVLAPLPVPVHPASLTTWKEDVRPDSELNPLADAAAPRKEGPKVTGRPKAGEEGGIFW